MPSIPRYFSNYPELELKFRSCCGLVWQNRMLNRNLYLPRHNVSPRASACLRPFRVNDASFPRYFSQFSHLVYQRCISCSTWCVSLWFRVTVVDRGDASEGGTLRCIGRRFEQVINPIHNQSYLVFKSLGKIRQTDIPAKGELPPLRIMHNKADMWVTDFTPQRNGKATSLP